MSKSAKSLKAMPTIAPRSAYRVSARLFHAVAMFRAVQDIRYYLAGVLFTPHPSGGAMIAATNGHQLCVAYDPNGAAPADRIVACFPGLEAAAGRAHEGFVHMDEAPESRVIVSNKSGVEAYIQPGKPVIEGNFPDIFRLLPRNPSKLQLAAVGAVNAQYLGRIAMAAKRLRLNDRGGMALHQWQMDPESVLVSRLDGEPNVVILTMPMRSERPDIVKAMATFQPMPKKAEPAPVAAPAPAVPEPAAAAPAAPQAAEQTAVQIACQALQAAATALAAISADSKADEKVPA